MNLSKKISEWQQAKLISASQGEAIAAYESRHKKPVLMYAMFFLSIFCIGLGIISLIASNWQEIPAAAKLVLDILLLGIVGAGLLRAIYNNKDLQREILILLNALLILGSIGLVGQIYHLQPDGYKALLLWAGLSAPLLALTQKPILAIVWLPVFIVSLIDSLTHYQWFVSLYTSLSQTFPFGLAVSFLTLWAIVYYGLRLLISKRHSGIIRANRLWMSLSVVLLIFMMDFFAGNMWVADLLTSYHNYSFNPLIIAIIILSLSGLSRYIYTTKQSYLIISILTTIFVFSFIYYFLPSNDTFIEIWGFLLTLSCLSLVVAYGVRYNRNRVVNLATGLIALRIFIVYLQVFGSLLDTGIGLVVSGLVFLAIIWLWKKFNIKGVQL